MLLCNSAKVGSLNLSESAVQRRVSICADGATNCLQIDAVCVARCNCAVVVRHVPLIDGTLGRAAAALLVTHHPAETLGRSGGLCWLQT